MHVYMYTYVCTVRFSHLIKVESTAGLEGLGEELAVDAVLVSSTSIIVHTDDGYHHQHQHHHRYAICDIPRGGWEKGLITNGEYSSAIATITTMATSREEVDRRRCDEPCSYPEQSVLARERG